MFYRILADIIVIIHLAWILFLILGAFPGSKYRTIKFLHVSGLVFASVIQIFDWYCPFTHLEVWLRSKHDPSLTYKGSFIIHYMEKIIYVEIPANLIFTLTILLVLFNAWFYLGKRRA
ncbi:MAG: DUF2784 domain-containing protein [Nitrospirota bacterium]